MGILCTALYYPCDNATNQPIIQCSSSCEKYRTTLNDTACIFLWKYFTQYTSFGKDVISLLQLVNCSDPSTYYFGDVSFSSTQCYSSFNDPPPTAGRCIYTDYAQNLIQNDISSFIFNSYLENCASISASGNHCSGDSGHLYCPGNYTS